MNAFDLAEMQQAARRSKLAADALTQKQRAESPSYWRVSDTNQNIGYSDIGEPIWTSRHHAVCHLAVLSTSASTLPFDSRTFSSSPAETCEESTRSLPL